MKRYGLKDYQAAAFPGNFAIESNLFHADHEYGQPLNKGGYGWAQWTSRRALFFKYIREHGGDEKSTSDRMSFQMNEGFLFHELDTNYSSVIDKLKKTDNVDDARL